MPELSHKIFYDVTQLVHWSGKLTGIPRVMHELASRFEQVDKESITFVSWVKDTQELFSVDLSKSLDRSKGQGVAYIPKHTTSTRTIGKQIYTVRRIAKAGLHRIGKIAPNLSSKIETKAKLAHIQAFKLAEINSGDILFIPWGEWWDPSFTRYLKEQHKRGVKIVQVIHDMGTTLQPQFFEQVDISPEIYNREIVPISSLVLAVSNNTKKELIHWLHQEKLKVPSIEVFREGDDFFVVNSMRPKDPKFTASKLKGDDFILTVGTIEAKKNHMLYYYVYKLAAQRGIKLPKLVIVGRRGWRTETTYDFMTKDPEVKDRFVFMHNASDEELSWLYNNCLFTIMASFHEGWGIPIAESVARGVPCLCSNTSSMVEIAEGFVEHFTPFSTDECLAAIEKLLLPANLKSARQKAAKYKETSWDESFSQVRQLLEGV